MKKFSFILLISLITPFVVAAQQAPQPDAEGSLVKWMTLQEAMEKVKTQPKPLLVDFYTSWCGWCKQMMRTTYADPNIASYINQNFYPVKFDAETKDTVEYLGQKYGPNGVGKNATNTLAIKMLQGKLMYPTILFMNNFDKQKNDFTFNMLSEGYSDAKKFEPMLVFTLENAFRNSSFDDFKEEFDKAFFDPAIDSLLKEMKWLKPTEAFDKKDSSDKKIMVLVHTDWCNACRVMYRTSFNDPLTDKYIKEHFELVDFNPELTDAITFKGQVFTNPRSPQMPFHQLAVNLCRNSLTLPTLVIMDKQMNVIDAIPFYLGPKVLRNIAMFYGDDIYKKKSWADFMAQIGQK